MCSRRIVHVRPKRFGDLAICEKDVVYPNAEGQQSVGRDLQVLRKTPAGWRSVLYMPRFVQLGDDTIEPAPAARTTGPATDEIAAIFRRQAAACRAGDLQAMSTALSKQAFVDIKQHAGKTTVLDRDALLREIRQAASTGSRLMATMEAERTPADFDYVRIRQATTESGTSVSERGLVRRSVSGPTFDLGTSFFAIGVYAGDAEWPPREMEEAGFNFAICPASAIDTVVRSTQAMKVCAGLPPTQHYARIKAGDYSGISPVLTAFRGHSRLVGWYLDEPGVWKAPLPNCMQIRQMVKRENPAHHFMAAFWHKPMREHIPNYASAFDVVLAEAYMIPDKSMSAIADQIRWARQAVPADKPMCTVVQGFDTADHGRQGNSRPPTPAEVRCAAYLGPILGYQGVTFYSVPLLAKRPPLMTEAKRTAGELRRLTPVLLEGAEATVVRAKHTLSLIWSARTHKDKTYILAANPTDRALTVSLQFRTSHPSKLPKAAVLFENRDLPVTIVGAGRGPRRAIGDNFGPLAVHVYEMDAPITFVKSLRRSGNAFVEE